MQLRKVGLVRARKTRVSPFVLDLVALVFALSLTLACNRGETEKVKGPHAPDAGPAVVATTLPAPRLGDPAAGREVFRFETFGNEGFWTDAMRLPKGMADAKFTTKQALESGLQIDIEAVPAPLRAALIAELKTDLSPARAPKLHDPKFLTALVNANAIVGIVPKDTNGDQKIDVVSGDKVGLACTICHTITDESVFAMAKGGSVGKRVDGPAALNLNVGRLLALAANSRAYYPNLQQTFLGVSIGRASSPLGPESTEAEVDAYLTNPAIYPVGTFDETQDGNGNSVKNTPLFRQDLAAPYGSAGEFAVLDDISNASYTTNLDPTTLTTPEGEKFLEMKGGPAAKQLIAEYKRILKDTGVTGYPFVKATMTGKVGVAKSPVGRRVDDRKLADMNAYLHALQAPAGAPVDRQKAARGEQLFVTNCTRCHNADQSKPVPAGLIALEQLWPGYTPLPAGVRGDAKLSTILNSLGTFDDKMVIVDASDRGEKRGNAMPLLLDLARTRVFLHDASVGSLEQLLDPRRGDKAPHPFYLADTGQRADMVDFLRGLDTNPGK